MVCKIYPTDYAACRAQLVVALSLPQKLWAEGGWRRFFKGFTPCLARAVPANGAMLLTVERVTALLNPE